MKKRYISLWLLSPLFVILILIGLVFSPLGTPLLKYAAHTFVPNLAINDIDGALLSDLKVEGLTWQNDQWQVQAELITVNVSWNCVLTPEVCIENLSGVGITVAQLNGAPQPEEETTETTFSLPIPISINTLSLERAAIALPGQTFRLSHFHAKLMAYERIALTSPTIDGLVIELAAAELQPEEDKLPQSYSLSYSAPELPEISVPIRVVIENFVLKNASVKQGEEIALSLPLATFEQLVLEKSDVSLQKLHVEHPHAEGTASMKAQMAGQYPLMMQLTADIQLNEEQLQTVTIDATGGLDALNLTIEAGGTYQASATVEADLLDNQLPLAITAAWPEQKLPALDEGLFHAGSLNLNGSMGNYQLVAKGGATVAPVGRVPAQIDITLNKTNITVNRATVAVLEGEIANTGTLYLNESISWSGTTSFSNISATSVLAEGPTEINGSLTSLMRMTANGPEVSVSGINLKGIQNQLPVILQGSLVYSVPSDIIVATLELIQQENTIVLAGQVLKNKYIDADVFIDLEQTNSLYPGVSGTVKGKVDVSGEWQDPQVAAQVELSDMLVSPSINSFLAQQGGLNGIINAGGQLSSHTIGVDVTLPDHKIQFALSGAWQQERWQATISESELGLLTTRWQLQAPFNFTLAPSPLDIKVNSSCWQSRAEGELCLENLLYQDDKASWQLQATGLPVGLWVKELAPEIIPEAPEATLKLNSTGSYSPASPVQATFDAFITPATWKLGSDKQVVLKIKEIKATGDVKDDRLNVSSSLISDELGAMALQFTLSPLAEDASIDGNLTFDGIDVSPLQPISPAIRELSGVLNGEVNIAGLLTTPDLTGSIRLENGAVNVEDMPVQLDQWQQTVTLHGKRAEFNGDFILGDGPGSISGNADWADELSINVALKGKRFEVRQPDMVVRVSPDLNASFQPGDLKITGSVAVPWARINIEELPESAVSPSKDVHLRGEPPSEDPFDIINASIQVNIDKNKTGEVKLEAFGLEANLHGSIRINTQPALVAYGDLQVMDGRYEAYGQNLLIQTGQVQFNGPLDQPLLLIEAIRDPAKTDDGVTAGIRIDGPADQPNVNLFSEPTMNQSAVLAYLLNGRAPGAESQDPNYAALLLGFGLSRTESLTGQVGSALGIEEFSLSTTSGSGGQDPKLAVSGQLTDKLSVQYNVDVGLNNSNATSSTIRRRQEAPDVAVRYQLLPKLYLEAVQTTIEDQSEHALDLYYEFFLGENKPQAVEAEEENESSD